MRRNKTLTVCIFLCILLPIHLAAFDSNTILDAINASSTPDEDSFIVKFINMLATLGLMLAAILLIAWFIKRFNINRLTQINDVHTIKILEKRALSTKCIIYVLNIRDKEIIIAESPQGVFKLSEATRSISDESTTALT